MDEVLRTQLPGWQARIEGAAPAEVAGATATAYRVGLLFAGEQQTIEVLAVPAADLTAAARADLDYQQQAVLRHVFALLETGWTPVRGALRPLPIGNPDRGYRHRDAGSRPSVLDRMLRRR